MKLYYSKGACSLAVRILLHEMQLKAEYEAVSLVDKKTASGIDFYSINPKGSVPVLLLDDKTVLTENTVIHQYLADTHHAEQLLPPVGNLKRYRVLEYSNFIATDLHKNFGPLFHPNVPDEIKEKLFIPLIKKRLSYLDSQLKDKMFLMGDQFTIADCYLYVILIWANHFKFQLQDFPQLERYFKALKERRSVADSLSEEGIHA